MSDPLYIAVTPETHARFHAQADERNIGSDEYVVSLLAAADAARDVLAAFVACDGEVPVRVALPLLRLRDEIGYRLPA